MEDFGREVAVIKTVFLRKANVAVAALLIFLNVQGVVSVLIAGAPLLELSVSLGLTALAMTYGLFAVNGYLTRIVLHEKGVIIRNLFSERLLAEADIKHVVFERANMKKMIMRVTLESGRNVTINTAKYKDWQPVVDYLQKFKNPTPRRVD